MLCEQAAALIAAQIDGELPAAERAPLDAHLAECPDCRALAEAFRLQHAELQTAFAPRRRAAVATARRTATRLDRPNRRWLWLGGGLLAAAATIAGVCLILLRQRPTTTPTIAEATAGTAKPTALSQEGSTSAGLTPRPLPQAPAANRLNVGESVQTAAGEKKRLQLPDGSVMFVNQASRATIRDFRFVDLDAGDIFVEVAPGTPFTVSTSGRDFVATGTKFAVSAAKDPANPNAIRSELLVTQGEVVVNENHKRLFLVSGVDLGQGELVTRGGQRPRSEPIRVQTGQEFRSDKPTVEPAPRASLALDWTRDLMAAAESPLVPASQHAGGELRAVDPYGQEAKLELRRFHIDVHIEDGFARTTIDQTYFNKEQFRLEGTFFFPLPADASLSRLAMYVDGRLMEGGMAERDHARETYERILRSQRDPALLEWVDGTTFKMRVFPLEPRQEKRLILSYTQRLPVLYDRTNYRFPAGHSLTQVKYWSFHATVKNAAGLTWASPTHPQMTFRRDGEDLLLDASAENVKVDRDVALELFDRAEAAGGERVRWNAASQDGARYLMLRYRPALPAAPRRERRDWLFLVETSADRDPLLARAQIELVRAVLRNAEHDDTFNVLTAGTAVQAFAPKGLPATAENIDSAVAFLEKAHLIGALDLGTAFDTARSLSEGAVNPYLVHVGGGQAALGETRTEPLLAKLSPRARYVGVGVGKRWNRALLKAAAARTGGYFTQVNPDEPLAWRGFDLVATLNTPRLLDVKVTAKPAAGQSEAPLFLLHDDAIAHGEELCAVARVTADSPPPEVTVAGTLDGKPFSQVLKVEKIAPGNTGHLPRTWARLEIERLLKENAGGRNKDRIVELSKAMYVMTPYTSLLVLENEKMYEDFRVDRGRKDHWALYPCPERIPVVYEPDPNRPDEPAGARRLAGQKPLAATVMQTVTLRVPPAYVTVPGQATEQATMTTWQYQRGDAYHYTSGDKWGEQTQLGRYWGGQNVYFRTDTARANFQANFQNGEPADVLALGDNKPEPAMTPPPLNLYFVEGKERGEVQLRRGIVAGLTPPASDSESAFGMEFADRLERGSRLAEQPWQLGFQLHTPVGRAQQLFGRTEALQALRQLGVGRQPPGASVVVGSVSIIGNRASHDHVILDDLAEADDPSPVLSKAPLTIDRQISERARERKALGKRLLTPPPGPPALYRRPSFTDDARVFADLPAYAPGLNTSAADVRAVLDEEAAPRFGQRPGRIDPAARALIDQARAAGWRTLSLVGDNGQSAAITFDGAGRFVGERVLPLGLRERVVCDGRVMLHLYPEIALAARRTVSRHHRAEFSARVPVAVPPAEDLAVGADVVAAGERTVEIRPHAEGAVIALRLVFAADGTLVERQLVETKTGKVLRAEAYSPTGIVVRGADGKELARADWKLTPAAAPDLSADTAGLVVVPFPVRSREHVYAKFSFDPNQPLDADVNRCCESLSPDAALELFVTDCYAGNAAAARVMLRDWFAEHDDHRLGLLVLLAMSGHDLANDYDIGMSLMKQADRPLARYLLLHAHPAWRLTQGTLGLAPEPVTGTGQDFLSRLLLFRSLTWRWAREPGWLDALPATAAAEQRALAFVAAHRADPLGWALLGRMQDHGGPPSFYGKLAVAWGELARPSGRPYAAYYEQARCLDEAGHRADARQQYRTLYEQALKAGVLPPLDEGIRHTLQGGPAEADEWTPLLDRTAAALVAANQRPALVALAWQCRLAGDSAAADNLLRRAVAGPIPPEQFAPTLLAAAEFRWESDQHPEADVFVKQLLDDSTRRRSPFLYRLAAHFAEQRGRENEAITYLEQALDLEYAHLPEVIDLQALRRDYGKLLTYYQKLAETAAALGQTPPTDLASRVVRAADRWRAHDPEHDAPCQAAAAVLRLLGETDLAWQYLTTPRAGQSNEESHWLGLAQTWQKRGDLDLADRGYAAAMAADPENAQTVWDRAQELRLAGREADADRLVRQLADGKWPAAYHGVCQQARWLLGRR